MNRIDQSVGFLVTGRVQGVGFRWSTRNKARELGLKGWVRNCADGRVEGEASGSDAAITALLEWLAIGPPGARVDAVDSNRRSELVEHHGFEIVN